MRRRANILHRLNRDDEALSSLSTAISLQPAHAGFHHNRGNLLFELKRFAEAFEAFDKAFALEPDLIRGKRSPSCKDASLRLDKF